MVGGCQACCGADAVVVVVVVVLLEGTNDRFFYGALLKVLYVTF